MIAMVSGGFDPLHVGHLELLKAAACYGDVVVALNSDDWLTRKKGRPFMTWDDRMRILREIRYVHDVVPVDDSDGTVCEALLRIRPDYFLNGGDRFGGNISEREVVTCMALGITQVFDVGGGKIRSSSQLIKDAK